MAGVESCPVSQAGNTEMIWSLSTTDFFFLFGQDKDETIRLSEMLVVSSRALRPSIRPRHRHFFLFTNQRTK